MKSCIKMILAFSFVVGSAFLTTECRTTFAESPPSSQWNEATAAPGSLQHRCRRCQTDCGCAQCPRCKLGICQLGVDRTPIKKTCFTVEKKTICIPPVRFPWMKCCPPGSAKLRDVCQLKKHTYECPNCKYTWSVVPCTDVGPPQAIIQERTTNALQTPIAGGISGGPPIVHSSIRTR